MAKTSLKELDFATLMKYGEGAKAICEKYENEVKKYDGSLDINSSSYSDFKKYNQIRILILNEIQKRLDNITL